MAESIPAAPETFACPSCKSVLFAVSPRCAACGSPLTVELSLAPIADPKRAYETARAVAAFFGAGSPAEWAKTLRAGSLRLASPKPWEDTVRFAAELGKAGAPAAVRLKAPVVKASPLPGLTPGRLALAGAFAAAVGVIAVIFSAGGGPAEAPPAPVASAAAPAFPPPPPAAAPEAVPVEAEAAVAAAGEAPQAAAPGLDFEAVKRSIVLVTTPEGSQGSGFLVAPGVVLTNRHVVGDRTAGSVVDLQFAGEDGGVQKTSARVARVGKRLDLAVIQCGEACAGLGVMPLGRMGATPLGDTVFALGNPFGLTLTLSRGIISHKARAIEGVLFVQSDVSVNPGNSGGPLFNERGEAVGVVTAKSSQGEGISFILPIEYALEGGDPVLDGFVEVREAYGDAMLEMMRQAGVNPGDAGRPAAAAARVDEEIQLVAAATAPGGSATENLYAVRFAVRFGPASIRNTSGPFFVMVEQPGGFKGAFLMEGVPAPQKMGDSPGQGQVYLYEYRGTLSGAPRLAAGTMVAVRMGDDLVSNKVLLRDAR